jgi:hypothetical protein
MRMMKKKKMTMMMMMMMMTETNEHKEHLVSTRSVFPPPSTPHLVGREARELVDNPARFTAAVPHQLLQPRVADGPPRVRARQRHHLTR